MIAAHRMDPARRELYVEGPTDKIFLEWLAAENKSARALVRTVDLIHVPDVNEGGNRERLVRFMELIKDEEVRIKGLIDADNHHFQNPKRGYPPNLWITDWRSIESYVISEFYLDKALRLGCAIDSVPAKSLFPIISSTTRKIAAIRYLSESENLRLPVNEYRWLKYIDFNSKGGLTPDVEGILRSLLQAAHISVARLAELTTKLVEVEATLAGLEDQYVLHGHDFMKILTEQLKKMGVKLDDAGRLMWTAFERDRLTDFPTLSSVVTYLCDDRTM
ncbi:hypothetical protein [Streptosporangium sp. CA-115845]|uniref:hypothetical protein n=1 Tax=Streptosporangium sp. CA-115845 TaxID=3240071 RepID=UPI003D8E9CDE